MIRDMTMLIASAMEDQYLVIEDINQHIVVINDAVSQVPSRAMPGIRNVRNNANSAARSNN